MARVSRLSPPEGLLSAVTAAVDAMVWLTPSDQAMVALALGYAKAIDGSDDPVKAAGWLGPHLGNVLRALGGAPGDRKALGVEEPVRGKLAELRAAR